MKKSRFLKKLQNPKKAHKIQFDFSRRFYVAKNFKSVFVSESNLNCTQKTLFKNPKGEKK